MTQQMDEFARQQAATAEAEEAKKVPTPVKVEPAVADTSFLNGDQVHKKDEPQEPNAEMTTGLFG